MQIYKIYNHNYTGMCYVFVYYNIDYMVYGNLIAYMIQIVYIMYLYFVKLIKAIFYGQWSMEQY